MRARFIGQYDTLPTKHNPDLYKFQQDFGFLRSDGLLIISPVSSYTDGASIPRFFWRLIGHPLQGRNKYWAAPHDSGYKACAIIIDVKRYYMAAEDAFEHWEDLDPEIGFIHRSDLPRKWWDRTLLEAMAACKESWVKRRLVYMGVRIGGSGSFQK